MHGYFQDREALARGIGAKKLPAAGYVETFERNGLHLYSQTGASTTAVTCPPFTTLPPGFYFTLDNTLGSGNLTLVPTTGSTLTVSAGQIKQYIIGADGVPAALN